MDLFSKTTSHISDENGNMVVREQYSVNFPQSIKGPRASDNREQKRQKWKERLKKWERRADLIFGFLVFGVIGLVAIAIILSHFDW